MPRYAANVSMLFTDLPFLDRFEAAAEAGFEAVEFLWPSPEQLGGRSIRELAGIIGAAGLQVALFNFDAGDMSAGWRGLAGVPEARDRFRANIPVAIEFAGQLGCGKLNALAGNRVPTLSTEAQLDVLVDGLAEAAEAARPAGIRVMLEALNPVEFPDYLVLDSATALDIVDRAPEGVAYQFDVYHMAMAGEDPLEVIAAAAGRIGHVQFADFPGRHEPTTGQLDWPAILEALEASGYRDWIGLEYKPTDPSSRGFEFLSQLRAGPPMVDEPGGAG